MDGSPLTNPTGQPAARTSAPHVVIPLTGGKVGATVRMWIDRDMLCMWIDGDMLCMWICFVRGVCGSENLAETELSVELMKKAPWEAQCIQPTTEVLQYSQYKPLSPPPPPH